MKRSRRLRVTVVSLLTAFAAGAGVWAQQGTEVTLTKLDQERLSVSGTQAVPPKTASGFVDALEYTTEQPPAPGVTSGYVSVNVSEADSSNATSCTAWGSAPVTDQNTVHVGPGATTGSVAADDVPGVMTSWGTTSWGQGPALLNVRASASSDNSGPPNEQTSNWYSPDRSQKVTTHTGQFQNLVTDGRIAVTAVAVVPLPSGINKCSADVEVTSGLLFKLKQSTHVQSAS